MTPRSVPKASARRRLRGWRAAGLWAGLTATLLCGGMAPASNTGPDRGADGTLAEQWRRAYEVLDAGGDEPRITLKRYLGKIVVINFWASWCPPCIEELPALRDFQDEHGGEVQVVGIGLDTPDKLRNVARTLHLAYPLLVESGDPFRELAYWGNPGGKMPYTVFADADGVFRILHTGPLDRDRLQAYLQELREAAGRSARD